MSMRRWSVVPSFILVQAVAGFGASRVASAQEPAPAVSPELQHTASTETDRCVGGDDTALLASLLGGDAIDGVEPLYGAPESAGAPDRLIGATIKIKPSAGSPAVNAAAVRRALECDAARRTLGRPGAVTAPNDPFWLAGHPLSLDVAAAHDGYRVVVRALDPAGAEQVLAAANALVESAPGRRGSEHGSAPDQPGEAPAPSDEGKPSEPFAFGDFTWLNGTNRQEKPLLDTPYFTGSFLLDVNYTASQNNPIDHTVVGSTALSRNNELTVAFVGFGGDFHWKHARGRLMTQFGVRSTLVPRNDLSANRGAFDLQTAMRYLSEAYGGYHFDALHGINLDAGIFMSYVGLFSYDNFENWMYLPSFTSDNTPWFFDGIRLQVFTSDKLKIEPWLINGWQSYGKFNELPGFGAQVLYRPTEKISVLSNDYVGWDTQDHPGRFRFHTDNSFQYREYENKTNPLFNRAAFSITADLGGESGDGVTPFGGGGKEGHCSAAHPCTQNFLSAMAYHRLWFFKGKLAWTVGGGVMHNPGRYLVLAPPGNASAVPQPLNVAPASDPFDTNPGTNFDAFDYETGLQFMPDAWQTWVLEANHRQTQEPFFAGHGGVTSPDGYTTTATPAGWRPDLVKTDNRIIAALLVRF